MMRTSVDIHLRKTIASHAAKDLVERMGILSVYLNSVDEFLPLPFSTLTTVLYCNLPAEEDRQEKSRVESTQTKWRCRVLVSSSPRPSVGSFGEGTDREGHSAKSRESVILVEKNENVDF